MAKEGNKRSRVAAALPPRTLNVQKFAESRATELEALHSIVAKRLSNDFRSQRNKRRRTTGHDNRLSKRRWRKRQKTGVTNKVEPSSTGKDEKKVPRRVLRRIGFKSNPQTGFCTSADGTKRLRTHLWHAKRFAIMKRWGFYIPMGLQGRERGSRALLRWFKHGVLVHDASYISAVQLAGPEDSILSILRMVLLQSPSGCLEGLSPSVLSGVRYGRAMLHRVGAPSSQLIAPVTYMWRPMIKNSVEFESGNVTASVADNITHNTAGGFVFRQLWLWIHAAAFNEGTAALLGAIKKQRPFLRILSLIPPMSNPLTIRKSLNHVGTYSYVVRMFADFESSELLYLSFCSITFGEVFTDTRNTQAEDYKGEIGPANSIINSDSKCCDSTSLEQDNSSFSGFVARTSNTLFNYFSEVHIGNLLRYPTGDTDDKDFSASVSNESKPNWILFPAKLISLDQKLCFLRVHLRAYKEGVFEEGAVVCAPHLSDVSLWMSRSHEQDGRLRIPVSSIGSYFTQLPCSKWELSKSEAPAPRESLRWPVGFITTGFVRGSEKPLAEAFCEAALLGKLRREQCDSLERKQKHEVFVLVRNPKSAAYRLALATIVLEQHEEDFEFM